MIKKVFIFNMGLIIINILGILFISFLKIWDLIQLEIFIKLGLTFLLFIFLGLGLIIVMSRKYVEEDLLP